MYFPYLRGRQYELIALRELVGNRLLSENIIPIIEPVKLSSTLTKTIEAFINNNHRIAVVCNPAVGSFFKDFDNSKNDINKQRFMELLADSLVIKSVIMDASASGVIESFNSKYMIKLEDWIAICNNHDYLESFSNVFGRVSPKFTLIPDEFRRKIRNNKVLLDDKFNKCDRNSDYLDKEDEFFSEDHLFYEDENYKGFADYSVIGKDYLESGFAPFAVAIHMVYFDKDNNLRIHHFVSDSNEDIQNPAKKFYEAVEKLSYWQKENICINTEGLSQLLQHYEKGTYPGLGSLKKLSLMHHLELMGKFLDKD